MRYLDPFLKNMVNFLPDYIFWKDTRSVYLGCNENFARMIGFNSPENIVGKTDYDLPWQAMGHGADIFRRADQETMAGHPIIQQEEILSLPSGKTVVALVSKQAIKNKQGEVLGIIGYFTDISGLKQKEKELVQAKKDAEAANQAKATFIANMRHSIITPLSGLLGMIKILGTEISSPEGKIAVENALQAANRLLELLNEVMEMARLASGALPVYATRFNLKDLVDKVIKIVVPAVQEKNLRLQVSYDKKLNSYFSSDAIRIHRILLNLISNAIKFTEQGEIKISLQEVARDSKKSIVKIQVTDTGIGIPEDKQGQIFTRFSRLTPAHQGIYMGSGLGLAVVKQFISELEGEIEVKSIINQGTTFICILPLQHALIDEPSGEFILANASSARPANLKVEPTTPPSFFSSPCQVLLVEDNKIAQISTMHQLKALHCEISLAESGEQAVSMAKEQTFDLILMDVGLPGIDGVEATRQIRQFKKNKRSVIVALSAHLNTKQKGNCLAAGMNEVFNKPMSSEKFKWLLSQLPCNERK